MPLTGYDETLIRFQLEKLKYKTDLQVTNSGDIAVTREGDLQFGDFQTNALFRLVERWRQSESTINHLFEVMFQSIQTFEKLTKSRQLGEGSSLSNNPIAFHEVTDTIIEHQLIASTLAGSIFVVLNNLLQRFKKDLNASLDQWQSATPKIETFSIGEIYQAAAANFRHYDEWAATKSPTKQQLESMSVLCGLLGCPVFSEKGYPSIQTNICEQVLLKVSKESVDYLHEITFEYAKKLAKYS